MSGPLFLPALQGSFGDWTYYSALIRLDEVAGRIGYAAPLHQNAALAQIIQRRLDEQHRAAEISDYLLRTKDRFFNSLVVGVLGGAPNWHPFSLSSREEKHQLGVVVERDQDLVGYLELSGEEQLFALDGQHRLAGIKRALKENVDLGAEKLSVIFVPHKDSPEGIIRTRSLFVSLNKKAVPVKRKDIIILDEVDLPAIVTRKLIDFDPRFSCEIIDVEKFGNSIPASSASWTSIGNFYDANSTIIYKIIENKREEELKEASKIRLPEHRIDHYQSCVVDFYEKLASLEPMLRDVLGGNDPAKAITEARSASNPRLLARPIGLKIFTNVAAEIRKTQSLKQTYRQLGRIPLLMTSVPFLDIIWDKERGRMISKGESLATRLLLHMLGFSSDDTKLRLNYAEWLGKPVAGVTLPRRFPSLG